MSKYTAEQAEKEADALLLAGIPFGRAAGMLLAYANLLRERDQPRGLGDGTSPVGATIRCHKCGEETKIAFNYGHAIEGCCNQSPCARPGVGPCNRPAAPDDWKLVPVEPTTKMLRAGFLSDTDGFSIETPADAPGLVYRAMLAAAPQPPAVVNDQLTTEPRSVAPPALYQHDDGRYALALGDVARHKLTDGDPDWHRVPLDVVVSGAM